MLLLERQIADEDLRDAVAEVVSHVNERERDRRVTEFAEKFAPKNDGPDGLSDSVNNLAVDFYCRGVEAGWEAAMLITRLKNWDDEND